MNHMTLKTLRSSSLIPLPIGCCHNTSARKTPAISTRNRSRQSWQPLSNSWSTLSQPHFARALGRRKTARNRQGEILYTECSKVGQLLVNSSPTPHPMGSCRGLPCSGPLATPEPNQVMDVVTSCNSSKGALPTESPCVS